MMKIRRHTKAGPRLSRGPFATDALSEHGRPLTVELFPTFLKVRPAGSRRALAVDFGLIYVRACQDEAKRIRAEKAKAREAARKARAQATPGHRRR